MTIHRIESIVSDFNSPTTRAVAFCGVTEEAGECAWPTKTMSFTRSNCLDCAAKIEAVSRSEWAAVKP